MHFRGVLYNRESRQQCHYGRQWLFPVLIKKSFNKLKSFHILKTGAYLRRTIKGGDVFVE